MMNQVLGCPRKLGSMVRIDGLFHLLRNGIYWGYNPLILTFFPALPTGHPSIWVLGILTCIIPENGPLEKAIPVENHHFLGLHAVTTEVSRNPRALWRKRPKLPRDARIAPRDRRCLMIHGWFGDFDCGCCGYCFCGCGGWVILVVTFLCRVGWLPNIYPWGLWDWYIYLAYWFTTKINQMYTVLKVDGDHHSQKVANSKDPS